LAIQAGTWEDVRTVFPGEVSGAPPHGNVSAAPPTHRMAISIRVHVSSASLLSSERSWMHSVRLHSEMSGEDISVRLIQHGCSQVIALPPAQGRFKRAWHPVLRAILAMLPTSVSAQGPCQRLDWMCSQWSSTSTEASSTAVSPSRNDAWMPFATHISAIPRVEGGVINVSSSTHTWLEHDECGDTLQYSMARSVFNNNTHSTLSLRRLLIPRAYSGSAAKNDDDSRLIPGPHTLIAKMTLRRGGEALGGRPSPTNLLRKSSRETLQGLAIERRRLRSRSMQAQRLPASRIPSGILKKLFQVLNPEEFLPTQVEDTIRGCDMPAHEEHGKDYAPGTLILDNLFGPGRGRAFLEEVFQRNPFVSRAHGNALVEKLTMDAMLEDYRRQNKMHLVKMMKCRVQDKEAALASGAAALSAVSDLNCTLKLAFEQLPSAHVFTEMQAALESDILTPVSTHVYVSRANKQALDIHTDPYDVFAVQLAGKKRWKMCLPRDPGTGAGHGATCLSPTDRALKREMLGWGGLGGTNYKPEELDAMDCELVETSPGDTLYLPRAFIHVAEATSSEPSVHVTFGLQETGRRWRDVVKLAVQSVPYHDAHQAVVSHLLEVFPQFIQGKDTPPQAPGTQLVSERFRWYQPFPFRRCLGSLDASGKEKAPDTSAECRQQFAEFQALVDQLEEYLDSANLDATRRALRMPGFLHAIKHHLRLARTPGMFAKAILSLQGTVAEAIWESSGRYRESGAMLRHILSPVPGRLVWAQRALAADVLLDNRMTVVESEDTAVKQRRERRVPQRDLIFHVMDSNSNGMVTAEEVARYLAKFGIELEQGAEAFVRHPSAVPDDATTTDDSAGQAPMELSGEEFKSLPPIYLRRPRPVMPWGTSAAIRPRLLYLQAIQSEDSSKIPDVPAPSGGRSLLSTSTSFIRDQSWRPTSARSLLAVNIGQTYTYGVSSCDASCDDSCENNDSCPCDGNCGCDGSYNCDANCGCDMSCENDGNCGCDCSFDCGWNGCRSDHCCGCDSGYDCDANCGCDQSCQYDHNCGCDTSCACDAGYDCDSGCDHTCDTFYCVAGAYSASGTCYQCPAGSCSTCTLSP
jgi:hypothetical protein